MGQSEDDTVQLRGQGDVLRDGKLPQRLVLVSPGIGLVAQPLVLVLDLLQVRPLLGLFHLQLILLFDSLDTTTGRVSSILERSSPLLHPHDLVPGQTAHLQRPIEVPDRNRDQFIVADVGNGAR